MDGSLSTTGTYSSQFWRQEVQGQGYGTLGLLRGPSSWLQVAVLSLCLHMVGSVLVLQPLVRALTPFMMDLGLSPPKAPPPNIIPLGIRFQWVGLGDITIHLTTGSTLSRDGCHRSRKEDTLRVVEWGGAGAGSGIVGMS